VSAAPAPPRAAGGQRDAERGADLPPRGGARLLDQVAEPAAHGAAHAVAHRLRAGPRRRGREARDGRVDRVLDEGEERLALGGEGARDRAGAQLPVEPFEGAGARQHRVDGGAVGVVGARVAAVDERRADADAEGRGPALGAARRGRHAEPGERGRAAVVGEGEPRPAEEEHRRRLDGERARQAEAAAGAAAAEVRRGGREVARVARAEDGRAGRGAGDA
jgi:hypothetical protein